MPQYKNYNSEDEISELNTDVRNRRWSDDKPGFIDRIPPKVRFWSGIAAGAWLWYGNHMNYGWGKILLYLGVGAIILYLMFANGGLKRELTDRECRISLSQQLRWLQQTPMNGVITIDPGIKITVSTIGQRVLMDGEPWKREYKVEYHHPDGTVDNFSAGINVFNGDLVGFEERRAGYVGNETPNIKTIFSADLKRTAAAEQYLKGPGGFRR